ncbi:hypothetical protein JCM12298_12820 [Desulfothermus naphthae]
MSKKALTLRLPYDLYEETKKIAEKKRKSYTAFILELLEEKLKEERKKSLFDAFTLVAKDIEEADVEYAFASQREVVVKND